MGSKTFFSTQHGNGDAILESFLEQGIADYPETALGFLYCDSQIDYKKLVEGLSQKLKFPVAGGTTMEFPVDNGHSGSEISAMLLVVNKPEMRYSVVVSEPLDSDRHASQMQALYAEGRSRLGEEPKLAMLFFPLMTNLLLSDFIEDIFQCAGDVPVFGCTCTNDLINTGSAVFCDGKAYSEHALLIMLGGDIKPVCTSACQATPMVQYAPVVAEAKGNEVLRVDSSSFCDYLQSIGISPEDRVRGVDALMQYGPMPVIVENAESLQTDVPEVRCISYTDVKKGSGIFSAAVNEGAKVYMSILRQQDVVDSVQSCLDKLKKRMEPAQKEGYDYSAFFCVTCVARYFIQVGCVDFEREYLMEHLPKGCAPIGLYAFCEIGPVYSTQDDRLNNRFHSASITMCAF